jgi:DNA-binding MarR family transcriptional regulator
MSIKKDETAKNFGFPMDRAIKMVRMKYNQAFKDLGVDLTTEQWVLLSDLYENNGQSQSELAEGSYKNAPTVSRIIDLLCQKDLVERQRFDNDRRRYKIYLTQKGIETVELCYPTVIELRKKGWDGLNDADFEVFMRIINHILNNHV